MNLKTIAITTLLIGLGLTQPLSAKTIEDAKPIKNDLSNFSSPNTNAKQLYIRIGPRSDYWDYYDRDPLSLTLGILFGNPYYNYYYPYYSGYGFYSDRYYRYYSPYYDGYRFYGDRYYGRRYRRDYNNRRDYNDRRDYNNRRDYNDRRYPVNNRSFNYLQPGTYTPPTTVNPSIRNFPTNNFSTFERTPSRRDSSWRNNSPRTDFSSPNRRNSGSSFSPSIRSTPPQIQSPPPIQR